MEHPVIRVLFYRSPWTPLGFLVETVTGSRFTHVEVVLHDVHYKITLQQGSMLDVLDQPWGVGGYQEELRIPLGTKVSLESLEFPEIVLWQTIDPIDCIQYHFLRTLSTKYRLSTPVVNCVTMANIILNHNLKTNWFTGYTPDDLYQQVKQYIASC
jgi:hypothetical protein